MRGQKIPQRTKQKQHQIQLALLPPYLEQKTEKGAVQKNRSFLLRKDAMGEAEKIYTGGPDPRPVASEMTKLTTASARKMNNNNRPASMETPAILFIPKNMAINAMTKNTIAARNIKEVLGFLVPLNHDVEQKAYPCRVWDCLIFPD